ncbi:MAG TPA: ice-binding family protein, partial [Candidatus Kapabacteria bacterium]|nr:ice-binding family protein [Candidatus Kapabacteria bacterium]
MSRALIVLSFLSLFLSSTALAQTPPLLGTTSTYGAFSGEGAIENTGLTVLTGDVGTNAGSFTGFPPGLYTGAKHVADPAALVAKNDLINAYNLANLIPCDTAISVTMGNGQIFTPRTYCAGPASTITGTIIFDAKGDQNAVFVVKVGGALNAAAATQISLINGASAANIYWIVNGAVSILDNSTFYGTIIANGAIHLYDNTTLQGRMLAVVGAITMASNLITVPAGGSTTPNITIVTPETGDSVMAETQNYQIVWTGNSITNAKTIEYSTNGGATWTLIANIDSTSMNYAWDVPAIASNSVVIRVTDANGLTDMSGVFTIYNGSTTPSLVVLRPLVNESIIGGTQNYQITWTGNDIHNQKSVEYSLDGGVTWRAIGDATGPGMTFSWNVPDSATTNGLIRVTDRNGLSGTSGRFNIIASTAPWIVVTSPASGERIVQGTMDYQITWTGMGIATAKTIELSTDHGATWTLIANVNSDAMSYLWYVPNITADQAIIRVTDAANVNGTSGIFTIVGPGQDGSINSLTLTGLTNNNIGNNQNLGISWTYSPEIGANMHVEYTTNNGLTWTTIQNVTVNESTTSNWLTLPSGYYPAVHIRITSSMGMSRTSAPFSVGTQQSVGGLISLGYSLSNYPNPVKDQ